MHMLEEGVKNWGIYKKFNGYRDVQGLGVQGNTRVCEGKTRSFVFGGRKGLLILRFEAHVLTFLFEGCFKPSTS